MAPFREMPEHNEIDKRDNAMVSRKMRALITGANGLIGANLARELLYAGHEVRAMTRAGSDQRSLQRLPLATVTADVLEPASLATAMQGCEVVFHTAAAFTYWGWSPKQLETLAVEGTLNVIDAAHRAGVKRVVFTSSSIVLGSSSRPLVRDEHCELEDDDAPPYFIAKVNQERKAFEHAAALGIELVAICPTMSIGPHGYRLGPSNGIIISYLDDHFRSTYPGGCNIVAVDDIARALIIAAERGRAGERYIAGAENLEWPQLHRMISELCGLNGPYWKANHTSSFLAACAAELGARITRRAPLTTRAQARMVGRYYWYDHQKLAQLGFRPKPAREALATAISWLVASDHLSRQTRTTLKLSREVYAARAVLEKRESNIGAVV